MHMSLLSRAVRLGYRKVLPAVTCEPLLHLQALYATKTHRGPVIEPPRGVVDEDDEVY